MTALAIVADVIDPGVASAIILAAVSLVVGLITSRNNRAGQAAASSIETRKVDLDEFREYRETVNERMGWAEKRIEELEAMVNDEKRAREDAEDRARHAEERAERLERRVNQLEQVLRDHHMEIPAPEPDPPQSERAKA